MKNMIYKYFFEGTDSGFNIWRKFDTTYQNIGGYDSVYDENFEWITLSDEEYNNSDYQYSESDITDEIESDLIDITDMYLSGEINVLANKVGSKYQLDKIEVDNILKKIIKT